MHSAMRLVGERLPHIREQVARLFERDEVFRDLCDEYETCSEAAARMDRGAGVNVGVRDEYVALRLRLEGELLRYLTEHPDA